MTDQGPIEYVGRKKPKAPRRPRAQVETGQPATADRGPVRKSSRWGWLSAVAVIGGLMAAFVAYAFLGAMLRPVYVAGACDLSACSATGMVIAGWLVVALPAGLVAATAIARKRGSRTTRGVLLGLSIVAVMWAMTFIPGRRHDLSDVIKGLGADQFADGLLWALGFTAASVVVTVLLGTIGKRVPAIKRNHPVASAVAGAVLLAAAIPVAVSTTQPIATDAETIFPATLEMNGDVLTRTAVAKQRGCDGVPPDDSLLNAEHCILALHVAYRTTDSDAVTSLWAVLYSTSDAARNIRAALPPASTDTSAAVYSTSQSWLLLGTAAHADGSTIAKTDRAWVLWPLRQAAYRFIGFQNGLLLDPDPDDEVHPHTAA